MAGIKEWYEKNPGYKKNNDKLQQFMGFPDIGLDLFAQAGVAWEFLPAATSELRTEDVRNYDDPGYNRATHRRWNVHRAECRNRL